MDCKELCKNVFQTALVRNYPYDLLGQLVE